MPRGALIVCVLAGCGRVDFDARSDGGSSDGVVDAAPPAFIRFPMDDDPRGPQTLPAEPVDFAAPCGGLCPNPSPEHVVGVGSYDFDGTIRVELPGVIDTSKPFSITAWIKPDAALTFGSAISKPLDTTTVNNDISLVFTATETGFEGTFNGTPYTFSLPGDERGAWHHYALIYDGTNRYLIIDATTLGLGGVAYELSTFPLAIGADRDANMFAIPFKGLMDDLRIYPRALSMVEISSVFAER